MECSRLRCQRHHRPYWLKSRQIMTGARRSPDRGLESWTRPSSCHLRDPRSRAIVLPPLSLSFFPTPPDHLTMLSYPDRNHQFLFSLPGLENVDSARKHMIRRVYDACIYSLFSGDVEVARKAYGLLLRCKEFKWKDLWSLGIHMLNPHDPDRDNAPIRSQVEQLRFLMVRNHTRVSPSPSTCVRTQRIL